jgi:uncharacterized protein HemX
MRGAAKSALRISQSKEIAVSNEHMSASPRADRTTTENSDRDRINAANLPSEEAHQPDPMLQMTTGRMGAGGLTLIAIVVAAILGIVLYGLNSGGTAEQTATAPTHAAQPAAGGKSGAATPNAARANESGVKG